MALAVRSRKPMRSMLVASDPSSAAGLVIGILSSNVRASSAVSTGVKAPAGIAAMARRLGRPVIAFGGRVEEAARAGLRICFDEIVALSDVEPELTQKERMAHEPELLCRHGARLAESIVAEAPSYSTNNVSTFVPLSDEHNSRIARIVLTRRYFSPLGLQRTSPEVPPSQSKHPVSHRTAGVRQSNRTG